LSKAPPDGGGRDGCSRPRTRQQQENGPRKPFGVLRAILAGVGREEMEGWSEQPEGEVDAQPAFHTLRYTTRAQPALRQSPPRWLHCDCPRSRDALGVRLDPNTTTASKHVQLEPTLSRSRSLGSDPGLRWKSRCSFFRATEQTHGRNTRSPPNKRHSQQRSKQPDGRIARQQARQVGPTITTVSEPP